MQYQLPGGLGLLLVIEVSPLATGTQQRIKAGSVAGTLGGRMAACRAAKAGSWRPCPCPDAGVSKSLRRASLCRLCNLAWEKGLKRGVGDTCKSRWGYAPVRQRREHRRCRYSFLWSRASSRTDSTAARTDGNAVVGPWLSVVTFLLLHPASSARRTGSRSSAAANAPSGPVTSNARSRTSALRPPDKPGLPDRAPPVNAALAT